MGWRSFTPGRDLWTRGWVVGLRFKAKDDSQLSSVRGSAEEWRSRHPADVILRETRGRRLSAHFRDRATAALFKLSAGAGVETEVDV